MLFVTEPEAHEWASTGKAATGPQHADLPAQPGTALLHEPAPPAHSVADARSDLALAPTAPDPAPAADVLADAGNTKPPAAEPGNPAATSPTNPAPVDDDQTIGLREAFENHLPGVTSLDALRFARAKDRTFPKPVDKRGTELLYRAGDLKRWARNRPRAATGPAPPPAPPTSTERPCPLQPTQPRPEEPPVDRAPHGKGTPHHVEDRRE